MDPYEASVVRETAGCLFANLLKFRSGIRQLPIAVTPICSENVKRLHFLHIPEFTYIFLILESKHSR